MKALKIIVGLLAVFIILPIGLWLQYMILKRVQATDVMWLLYWVNVPLMILMQVVLKIVETVDDD